MQEGITVMAAICWVVVSGLIGVGIGVTAMCAFFLAKRSDEMNISQACPKPRVWIMPTGSKSANVTWGSDLVKGKSAKEGQ